MTANDRFKSSFMAWFWASLILATTAHFAVLSLWPPLMAQDFGSDPPEFELVTPEEEVPLPDEPAEVRRPAAPVVVAGDIDPEATIPLTTWAENPPETLPPPPDSTFRGGVGDTPTFTPYTVKPGIKNREAVRAALEREYPPLLRDAGIGGTTHVWFKIGTEGQILRIQVNTSSGHVALDNAALKVAEVVEFTPALNRDKRVEVWISLPITFVVR